MSRMDAIRKQYEQNSDGDGLQRPNYRVHPARSRNLVFKFFWLMLILSVLGGFFSAKNKIIPFFKGAFGIGSQPAPHCESMGKDLGTHQGAREVEVSKQALSQYLQPTKAEMEQLFEYVRNSSHVKENLLYAKTMQECRFLYLPDNETVNALAGLHKLDKDSEKLTRVVCFLGGAARFARVAALAVAAEQCGDKGAGARFLQACTAADCGKLDADAALRIVNEACLGGVLNNQIALTKAKSISAGLMLGIIAHECGHQSLGHVLKTGETVNLDISRNQEREADSFASSVISSSPFGEYILAGTLFWYYALANQQRDSNETTHPLAKERFENYVRSNKALAASLGIRL